MKLWLRRRARSALPIVIAGVALVVLAILFLPCSRAACHPSEAVPIADVADAPSEAGRVETDRPTPALAAQSPENGAQDLPQRPRKPRPTPTPEPVPIQTATPPPPAPPPTAAPPPAPPPPVVHALLVVASATSMNTSESAVLSRLVTRGFDVRVIEDDDAQPADGLAARLIVISKTVESEIVGATFRDATAGVLFWEDNAQALGMMATIDDSSHSDTAWHSTATTVEVDPAAPAALRAGLDGPVTLLQQPGEITYAPADGDNSTLGVGAIRVASLGDGDPRSVYYVYTAGATLADGSAAAGRRVFFGLYDDTYQMLSPEGLALFDAAVDWAAGN